MAEIAGSPDGDERLLSLAWARQEDQWHRKNTLRTFLLNGHVFGFPYQLLTNRRQILDANELALRRFTRGPQRVSTEEAILLRLFVREPDRDPLADALSNCDDGRVRFQYEGYGDSLAIDFGQHGHCAIDLANRTAVGFMSEALADRIELVARFIICTSLLNILTRCGLIQWHAASVVKNSKAFMLIGADNSGKSTTALTLMQSGYCVLGESLTYTRQDGGRFELMGFPVGQLRLRPQGMSFFPQWQNAGQLLSSNDGQKWLLELDDIMPDRVLRDSLVTGNLVLLFVAVGSGSNTTLRSLSCSEALQKAIPACSLWEEPPRTRQILAQVRRVLQEVPSYELRVGQIQDGIVRAVDSLLG